MAPDPGRAPRPVVVVGDVGLDVLARTDGPVVFGQDTRARVLVTPGGAGANTAVHLARHGVDVTLLARVGDDEAGRSARAELSAAGVRCRLAVDPVLPTCCVVVLVGPDGERTMLPDRGANRAFSVADAALPDVPGHLPGPPHLHVSGYVLLDDDSRAGALAAMAEARAAGWTVSVDPQTTTHLGEVGAATFLSWIDGIDLVLPNDAELAELGGLATVLEHAAAVAVTHGPGGASWCDRDRRVSVQARAVHATDSTGAGDAFDAGLLSAWLSGAGPREALDAGVRAGTAVAGAVGARGAQPAVSDATR
ncbi:carbohydrate kinase family protein [Nakamurella endophytica]|uniref:Ribokinase n=1 Tax=Nakamurella endophytica TaxID=1748367 RepID=A0A917T6D7_9ACTN|nr:PfkB family carbohydrate kinase [Nakamurella endophytica]GGM11892.1 ribokinase [Nakamurella endophytica]